MCATRSGGDQCAPSKSIRYPGRRLLALCAQSFNIVGHYGFHAGASPDACCCSLGYSTEGSSPSALWGSGFSPLPLQRRLSSSRVAQSPTSGRSSSATHFWLPLMGSCGAARGSSTVRTSQSSWLSQVCCSGLLACSIGPDLCSAGGPS